MKLEESRYSIAELIEFYNRGELIVNEEYQRQPRLWPSAARSYFIDTILCGFPFPKIYILEKLNKVTYKPHREIVDGQQRITSVIDFKDDKFALGNNSKQFEGLKFSTLSEEDRISFLSYTVAVEVIRDAGRIEILQMFRRMNAYTLPLNEAEKRHCEFFGKFKTWVTTETEKWSPIFSEWKILSSRSIVRMEDAEFITEIAALFCKGVVSSSPRLLKGMYSDYDESFPQEQELTYKLKELLGFVQQELGFICGTHLAKSYTFLSLVASLIHNKWGVPGLSDKNGFDPIGKFWINPDKARESLLELASAHETKISGGAFAQYVEACKGGANREKQRLVRAKYMLSALRA